MWQGTSLKLTAHRCRRLLWPGSITNPRTMDLMRIHFSSIGGSWWDGDVNWGFWLGECFHVSRWSTYSQTADAWKARATRLWPQSWQFLTNLVPKEAPYEAHHRLQWSGYALLALPGLLPMATTCRASNHQSGAGEKTAFLGFVSCRCIVWVSIAVEKIRVEVDDG